MYIYAVFLLIINVFCIVINAKDLQNDVTTSATPTSTLQRSRIEDFNLESENLTKRHLKETDLSSANTIGLAKNSYEPPPEFYRGPGSTGHPTSTQTSSYYNNYKPYNGFKSRPIAFPDTYNSNNNNFNKYNEASSGGPLDKSGVPLANSYNSWHHLKSKVGVLSHKKDTLQDRISVGHYGPSQHGSSASGYAYEGRPYGSHGEYISPHSHYGSGSSVAPYSHTGGYYGGSTAAEAGIPFDVYGSKNHYSGLAGNDYASYSYSDAHEPGVHKSHPDISHKALLAKSFLIPLASAAVLGIAAALVSNPLLLQLGTVSGIAPGTAVYGKRKRRDLTTFVTPNDESISGFDSGVASVDKNKKVSKLLPYRGHHHQEQQQQQRRHRHFVRT